MTKQTDIAGAVLIAFLLVVLETFGHPLVPQLAGAHWLISLGLAGLLIYAIQMKYYLTAVFVGIWLMRFVHLMKNPYSTWDEARMDAYRAAAIHDDRFDHGKSVDLQMADGTLKTHPPRVLSPPNPKGPLLLFPPTDLQLQLISGSQ